MDENAKGRAQKQNRVGQILLLRMLGVKKKIIYNSRNTLEDSNILIDFIREIITIILTIG